MKILKVLLLLYNSILILTLITIGLFTQPYNQLAPILLLIPVWLYFVLSLLDIFIVFAHLAYNQGILVVIKTLKILRIYSFIIVSLMIIASLAYSSNSFESSLTFIFLPLIIYLALEIFTKRNMSQFTVTNMIKVAKVVKKTEEQEAQELAKAKQKEEILSSISEVKRKRFDMDSLDTGIAEIFSEFEAGANGTPQEKVVQKKQKVTKELTAIDLPEKGELREIEGEEVEYDGSIKDFRRRQFLKIVGGGGVSMFLMLFVFQQKASAAFFGSGGGPGIVGVKDSSGTTIDPAEKQPTDGYSIAELDDNATPSYYGFTNKDGSWYIAREGSSGSYRYVKGTTNFSTNWTNRASLTYDYFDNVF